MKETICTVAGLVGGFIATLLGGDSPQCGEMSRSDRGDGAVSLTVNEFLLTKHNPRNIAMPSVKMEGIIGVTVHNTDWIRVANGTTPAEQYTQCDLQWKYEGSPCALLCGSCLCVAESAP